MEAGAGDVALIARNGSILDTNGAVLDVIAGGLYLSASRDLGLGTDFLEVSVERLALAAFGTRGVFVSEFEA